MDEFSRLKEMLAKLTAQEATPGRPRSAKGSPERLMSALVTELNETILPRRIDVTSSSGVKLHFAAANRRLQALLPPAPPIEGAAGLAGTAIADLEDENLGRLKAVVEKFLENAGTISFSSDRQEGPGFASDVGVPATQIARAWEVEASDGAATTDSKDLAGFLSGVGSRLKAWLLIDGEDIADQAGDAPSLAGLADQAALFLDGYLSRKQKLFQESGGATLILAAALDGQALIFFDAGGKMAFGLAPAGEAAALARDWQGQTAIP